MKAGIRSCVVILGARSVLLSAVAFFLAMLPLQGTAFLQTLDGVEVKIQAQPQTATVGDPIQIDLEFALHKGTQLEFPRLPSQVGDFTILETYQGPTVPPAQGTSKSQPSSSSPGAASEGRTQYRARVVAAAYKTGELDFPSLSFVVRDADGKATEVSSPPVRIRIASVLTGKDLSLKDLKKQAEIEEPFSWLLWFALGLSALLLLLLGWWMRRRRRQPLPAAIRQGMDPLVLAESELRILIESALLGEGFYKEFYVTLADIIRKLLEPTYGIQTLERTTAEIVDALRRDSGSLSSGPGGTGIDQIETFLLSCDMVKFARYTPSRNDNDEAIKTAFAILENCRKWRHAAVSATAPVAGVS